MELAGDSYLDPVLDPKQLARIEATHRGYGYQHLYSVACLLGMGATATDAVIIEYDEDIELVRADVHIYIQVKTRGRPLRHSDIDTALQRFDSLRRAHMQGKRPGTVRFAVVSNVEPGPELRARLRETHWPKDVALLWPGCPDPHPSLALPAAWPDLETGLEACVAQAQLIPFGSLTPQTLVLKLAGLVQQFAAGQASHTVTAKQVVDFFEQLVVQLQEFPKPPESYLPQTDEPGLDRPERIRLIVGVSGAGKTAWSSRGTMASLCCDLF